MRDHWPAGLVPSRACCCACLDRLLIPSAHAAAAGSSSWRTCPRPCASTSVCLPRLLDLAVQAGTFNHLIARHPALPRSYYVPDPSRGEAAGVVKGSEDRDISGKLELLKGGPIVGCKDAFLRGPRPRFVTGQGLWPAAHRPAQHCIQAGEALSSPCPSSAAPCPVPRLPLLCGPLPSPALVPPMRRCRR